MSRVTAAFVCALCDPDNPRPASIMCSNNCGRYVCAAHAVPRKGPGSAMICQSCAEALGLIDRPRPKPAPEVRPLLEISTEPEPVARPKPQASSSVFQVEPFATPETTAPAYQVEPFVTPSVAEAAPEIQPAAEEQWRGNIGCALFVGPSDGVGAGQLSGAPKADRQERLIKRYLERFHWPLAAGILDWCLIAKIMRLPFNGKEIRARCAQVR